MWNLSALVTVVTCHFTGFQSFTPVSQDESPKHGLRFAKLLGRCCVTLADMFWGGPVSIGAGLHFRSGHMTPLCGDSLVVEGALGKRGWGWFISSDKHVLVSGTCWALTLPGSYFLCYETRWGDFWVSSPLWLFFNNSSPKLLLFLNMCFPSVTWKTKGIHVFFLNFFLWNSKHVSQCSRKAGLSFCPFFLWVTNFQHKTED